MVDLVLGSVDGASYAVPRELNVDGRRVRLRLVEAGLACCAVEVSAAISRADHPEQRSAGDPGDAVEVLLVSGTVTDVLAPAVRALWASLPGPAYVLSFGACSNSGGPYWDSYSVTNGVDQLIPVDVYVPGCPPRPEALLDGLRVLLQAHP
jgi:NADH-quinone oxidoreductase subunit B